MEVYDLVNFSDSDLVYKIYDIYEMGGETLCDIVSVEDEEDKIFFIKISDLTKL